MPDPTVPLHLNIALQNHLLVPIAHYNRLVRLEQIFRDGLQSGLLVWRGDGPAPFPPPQTINPQQRAEEEQIATMEQADPAAFLRPLGFTHINQPAPQEKPKDAQE